MPRSELARLSFVASFVFVQSKLASSSAFAPSVTALLSVDGHMNPRQWLMLYGSFVHNLRVCSEKYLIFCFLEALRRQSNSCCCPTPSKAMADDSRNQPTILHGWRPSAAPIFAISYFYCHLLLPSLSVGRPNAFMTVPSRRRDPQTLFE